MDRIAIVGLGLIGGSLALSWSPDKGPKRSKKAAEAT